MIYTGLVSRNLQSIVLIKYRRKFEVSNPKADDLETLLDHNIDPEHQVNAPHS